MVDKMMSNDKSIGVKITGSVDGEKNTFDSVNIILIGICFNSKLTI